MPIHAFTPVSDPPCLLVMLPRHVNMIGWVLCVLHLRILLFALCMLRPTTAEAMLLHWLSSLVFFVGEFGIEGSGHL
ncbi:unnamed protein product [Schistosoma mattheei]|uniref:Uncharacterized protein n=1 Tax=Schistosoma mattheei TaxID=31246 RepID=A0A3P8FZQ9_9TREM|nr:unnamed protein product [Schistosoma mattheei]